MNHLVWFRNDLRLEDNTSLTKACHGEKVIAVYCFDPYFFEEDSFGFKKTEKYRAQFLIETVSELKENLSKLNIDLLVFHNKPETILPAIIQKHNIIKVFLQREWTQEETDTLDRVKEQCHSTVEFEEHYDQFLFHPEDSVFQNLGELPEVFTQFRKVSEKKVNVREPLSVPASKSKENRIQNDSQVPTLTELGLDDFKKDPQSAFPFLGGEQQGMKRIQHYFWETKKLAYYKKTRNGLLGIDYSSKLSPWLANGSLSARMIYWQVKRFEKHIQKNQDTYWLIFELIWRDYFKYISLKHGNAIFKIGGILEKEYDWGTSEKAKQEWINGYTKEPFVNANMIELSKTGWMSNRGRQNVASFWSKELCQDWRLGAAYFESLLLDYDVHSNWGNWMYNSGVGNDPRDRKFNSKRQAELYDPSGKYQRIWLQNTLF
ncbi:MAG: DASH family cryptochrome [Flavobacteriaceae bacterium]|nr:DASH family cryptochrome [Flavobacteriaceae bacterium]